MLQVALPARVRVLIILFIGISLSLLFISVMSNTQSIEAQGRDQDFQEMFSMLHSRMLDEGILVTVSLHEIVGGESVEIIIGYGYEDIEVSIHEIGKDYFCTREIRGSAELINCILYSNVAGITYINN